MFGLKKRVQRGADLLDRELPNWFNRIDTVELNQESASHCVLGQLYGDWTEGLNKVFGYRWDYKDSFDYGFSLSGSERWNTFGALTRLWKKEILKRRSS